MIRPVEDVIKQCEDFIKNHSDCSIEREWATGVEFVLEDYKRLLKKESIFDKVRTETEQLPTKIGIVETIGRLLATLIDVGIIERKQAMYILEPLNNKAESDG